MNISRRLFLPFLTAALFGSGSLTHAAPPQTIQFSGYTWNVRPAEVSGPGPNHWDPNNVRVDAQGRLHLTLNNHGGVWHCPEVYTQRRLGFGRYQFHVTGALDRLDPNVILGLFNYPAPGMGPDGTNEIDIEYSRWGDPAALPASSTIYPARSGLVPPSASYSFAMPPGLTDTTQRFDWSSAAVHVQCLRGHLSAARRDRQGEYARWNFAPADHARLPQQPLPVHINLWLLNGAAPQNGKPVEIIIKAFSFTPEAPAKP